ncbi:MAG TPA: hypothetical protein VLM85_16290 [Polyangiaceae bacterium]|nr:hypothetical protein [Polyangiaceae bacterium]
MTTTRNTKSAALLILLGALAGCSGSSNFGGDDASTEAGDDGGGTDGTTTTDGASGDSGGVKDSGVKDSGTIVADSGDGFAAVRTACINEINKLRATESKPPYALWSTSAIDTCVDEQATYDQNANSPHSAWINGVYPTCNGNGQDECLGYGLTPSAIIQCLDDMWNEKNQPTCSGCPACAGAYNPSCPNCDFYGQYGPTECGHYVNMSALYFSEAACGFSTLSNGSWAVQNFQ